MGELSFDAHVWACEYMGVHNPKMTAWMEGPHIGAIRHAYASAHKAHQETILTGDADLIDSSWEKCCAERIAFEEVYYS